MHEGLYLLINLRVILLTSLIYLAFDSLSLLLKRRYLAGQIFSVYVQDQGRH